MMTEARKIKSVYPSLAATLKMLQLPEYQNFPEIKELKEIFSKHQDMKEIIDKKENIFIVLEGLDAAGKSTIGKELAKALHGVYRFTPPELVSHLRPQFDSRDQALRRAYYALGNYLASYETFQLLKTQPVIMDRYWHSTSAYAIAEEVTGPDKIDLPAEGDSVYEFPTDLLKPDYVFFLVVSENVRNQRISRRKNKITEEEGKLKTNDEFRNVTLAAYNRMKNPKIIQINGDSTIKEVVQDIQRRLSEKLPDN